MVNKSVVRQEAFNRDAELPYQLRFSDFEHAMQDVYDFFSDVNSLLSGKGLKRLDDMMRPAMLSGMISDMMTASLAKFSRSLVENTHFNGHPDLVLRGVYADDCVASGSEGIEIKSTRKSGGAVDTHGAREQWMCVFVYEVDNVTEPAANRYSMQFTEVYLAKVEPDDFRKNARGELGTRTATLHAEGVKKLRANCIYKLETYAFARKKAEAAEHAKLAPAKRKKSVNKV
ncbi:hypothetical protein [Pseudomonas chlororaphis]|uniref:Uncharacterized protein n=1 Tax=Pseudomonas chlororaphis TaxID=587753 RepID=A0AAP9VZC4_9PSED|nr:hypothetical protein [Pseudomonas chlororaphis]QNR50176.1 hypothetical protein HLB40_11875 [Pseudomonas chlororaphis]